VVIADFNLGGLLFFTNIFDNRTAYGKTASRGQVQQRGGLTFDRVEPFILPVQMRYRVNQGAGVGMPGRLEYFPGGCRLHDFSGIHNAHPMAHVGYHAEVMGNKENSAMRRRGRQDMAMEPTTRCLIPPLIWKG